MLEGQKKIIIALDIMGGDLGVASNLRGAEMSAIANPDVFFQLFGDENQILPELAKCKNLKKSSEIMHAEETISSHEKPSVALRKGKNSSMTLAIESVKEKNAHAIVSSGNTGALMAISKIALRTLPGILRPAIAAVMPSITGKFLMLDLGANAECSAENLLQFAVMGDAFARANFGIENPRIGLLNIGSEDVKGNEMVKNASSMMRNEEMPLNFCGYVEGDQLFQGLFDVVVTDGFTGNVALKTAEGTAKFHKDFLKKAFKNNILAKLGYLLAKPSLDKIFKRFDHRLYNGAMLLGLGGVVVKSHGSAGDLAFSNAINVAISLAKFEVNDKIIEEINRIVEQYPEFLA